jgi:hypothetical protein
LATFLASVHDAAQRLETLCEERPHEVRLQAAGLGLLHLGLDLEEAFGRHRLLGEGVAVEQALQALVVEVVVDLLRELGSRGQIPGLVKSSW